MKSKEWFAEWFDTTYYHQLYANRNDEEAAAFIKLLIDFLDLDKSSYLLDLACGKGRHSITLNQQGFNVLGADLSANSIQEAKKNENASLEFMVHDMREIIPGKSFDGIFNLFTSFGYFDDTKENERVLHAIFHMLKPDGILVIDFMNASRCIRELVPSEVKVVGPLAFNIERRYDGHHIFKDIRFTDQGKDFHFTERVQALKEADFRELLTKQNFEIIRTFGDFSLNDFKEETSDRLILIARKK